MIIAIIVPIATTTGASWAGIIDIIRISTASTSRTSAETTAAGHEQKIIG